ncbi:hypothetical protein HC891_06965 [Candidatus Gracilibacteria bacterium]|nr:hypothetical protein [Candidatus Gracilibacteria bacterium]
MNNVYGQFDENGKHALAAHIWGHRLRAGQHWMEYMLEFLGVLAGFDYQLGQGLPNRSGEANYRDEYRLPKRLGLRRFVFYDGREKTPDPRDQRATDEIRRQLHTHLPADRQHAEELIAQLRSLLRSFSAIEDDRSWYAKSLFPVHEEFLLWEALRKGSTKRKYVGDPAQLPLEQLDRGIEFFARNFFARGGELYYLMISAGTEGDRERRERISSKIQYLLKERNRALGDFARIVNGTWTALADDGDEQMIEGRVGWLPDPACPLYRQFAEDLDCFLDNNLDALESLELLAHLISFHIVCYIYHRAHPASDAEGHASGSCLEACRPHILVDLLGDEDGGVLRERSAAQLRRLDAWQIERARALITDKVAAWANEQADDRLLLDALKGQAENYFGGARTRAKQEYENRLHELNISYNSGDTSREGIVRGVSDAVFSALSADFRSNFLAAHSKLGRAIGLIAPHKGPRPRFVLGDTLLKTLVTANLQPGEVLGFGPMLQRLYERYGIIVGPGEANIAGLTARLRINEEYYIRNRNALLMRLKRAGLVTQYSDATALVSRL